MLYFANFLSVLPLYYIIFTTITTIYSIFLNNNILFHMLYYFLGLMVSLFTPEIIKRFTKVIHPNGLYWYRPKGAKGCDFQSLKGFARPFTPGFPSGHMTLTSYVMVFNILMTLQKKVKYSNVIILFNLLFIIAMAWARYYKNCHNLFQIIGGILLGGFIARITLNFVEKIKIKK
jgi:membrane-associated phospholipid phosphatase